MKRRPSRRKPGPNRLSLPEEPSGYHPDVIEPQASHLVEPSAGPSIRSPPESSTEPPEDSSGPGTRPAARKPPTGAHQLPGMLSAELRGRLARRTGSREDGEVSGNGRTEGSSTVSGVQKSSDGPVGSADISENAPMARADKLHMSPSDVPDKAADPAEPPLSAVMETAATQGRTSPASGATIPETPSADSSASVSDSQPVSKTSHSPSASARPPVPARPASHSVDPTSTSTVTSEVSPAHKDSKAAQKSRAAGSLFDSDSDEDLFHMPAARANPAESTRTERDAKPAPSPEEPLSEARDKEEMVEEGSLSATAATANDVIGGVGNEGGGSGKDSRSDEGSHSVVYVREADQKVETSNPAAVPVTESAALPPSDSLIQVPDPSPAAKPELKPKPKPKIKPKPATTRSSPGPPTSQDSPSRHQLPESSVVPPTPPPSAGLFDDSDEEDLFHTVPEVRPATGASKSERVDFEASAGTPVENEEQKGSDSRDGTDAVIAEEEKRSENGSGVNRSQHPEVETGSSEKMEPNVENEERSTEIASSTAVATSPASARSTALAELVAPVIPAVSTVSETQTPLVATATARPSHSVFDSDSDEDLFQAAKPGPAGKGPDERSLKASDEGNATSSTLSGDHSEDSAETKDSTAKDENVDGSDVGPRETKEERIPSLVKAQPSDERTEISTTPASPVSPVDSVAPADLTPPTAPIVPAQPTKAKRDLFDSDSDEDLFQTAGAKAVAAKSVPTAVTTESQRVSSTFSATASAATESIHSVNPPLSEAKAINLSDELPDATSNVEQTPKPALGSGDSVEGVDDGVASISTSDEGRISPPVDDTPAEDVLAVNEGEREVVQAGSDDVSDRQGEVESGRSAAEAAAARPDQDRVEAPSEGAARVSASDTASTTATNTAPTVSSASRAAATSGKPSLGLFDSDDDEVLSQTMKPKSEVKTPVTNPRHPMGETTVPSNVTKGPVEPNADLKDKTIKEDSSSLDIDLQQVKDRESTPGGARAAVQDRSEPLTEPPAVSTKSTAPAASVTSNTPTRPAKASGGLFDSDSDDEDLFQTMKNSKPTPTASASVVNGSNVKKAALSQVPSKGASLPVPSTAKVTADPVNTSKKNQNVGKEPPRQSNLGEIKPSSQHPNESSQDVLPRLQRKDTKPSRSLFSSDSDEEDLFSAAKSRPAAKSGVPSSKPSSSSQQPKSAASTPVTPAGRSVRPAGNPSPSPAPAAAPAPASAVTKAPSAAPVPARTTAPVRTGAQTSPLQDSEDDEDLFGSARNAPRSTGRSAADWEKAAATASQAQSQVKTAPVPVKTSGSAKTPAAVKTTASAKTSSTKKLVPTKTTPTASKATGKVPPPVPSLFSDDDDEGDLFGPATTAPLARAPVRVGGRLFSDSDEETAPGEDRKTQRAAKAGAARRAPAQAKAKTGEDVLMCALFVWLRPLPQCWASYDHAVGCLRPTLSFKKPLFSKRFKIFHRA